MTIASSTRRVAGRPSALATALLCGLLGASGCGGDGGSGPSATPVTYDLLYVNDQPLPANIAAGQFFSEDLVSGKIVINGNKVTVVHDRQVSTTAGTTTPSDTLQFAASRKGDKLVITRPGGADGAVVDTILVDSAIGPDLYLHWPTTVVGQRGSLTAELTYLKHS